MNNSSEVLTRQGGKYELNKAMRERMVAFSNGDVLINENYQNDIDVMCKLAFLKHVIREDGSKFIANSKEQIKYVDANIILSNYNDSQKSVFMDNASIIQKEIIDLITLAFSKNATDIHITLEAPSTYIQFRILGQLVLHNTLTYDDGNKLCTTLYESMTTTSGTSFNSRTSQDANIQGSFLPDGLSGIRVATGATQSGNYFLVLRLLPDSTNATLESLGYSKTHLKAIKIFMAIANGGITVFSGPTGSGKSTSLVACIKKVLSDAMGSINLITVEDPVEYKIQVNKSITTDVTNQNIKDNDDVVIHHSINENGVAIITKTITKEVTYAAKQIAIPSTDDVEEKRKMYQKTVIAAMRQDPDFIMIGEIRDDITANVAVTASNTGHPVLTTLHASNGHMIIDRLIEIGADRELLLSPGLINGMIAQQLIPILCPNCKQKLSDNLDKVPPELIERLQVGFKSDNGADNALDGIYIRNLSHNNCGYRDEILGAKCFKGFITREVIAEVIIPDVQYLQYMREHNLVEANNYWLDVLGGYTMMAHGLAKVKNGRVCPISLEAKLKPITIEKNLDKAMLDV